MVQMERVGIGISGTLGDMGITRCPWL